MVCGPWAAPNQTWKCRIIWFSDFLWGFTQRCRGGDAKLRPKVSEVVTRLGKGVVDILEHREFAILVLPDVAHRAMTQVDLPIDFEWRRRESHRIPSYLWAIQPFEYSGHWAQ